MSSYHYHNSKDYKDSFNINAHFIGPNPSTSFIRSIHPDIDSTVYVSAFSSIIGDVTIKRNGFVAPNVSIRADEGAPFFIDRDTNIQDGVILHGLVTGRVIHNGCEYSIYIGKRVSCAHGCLVHGPCKILDNVFIGFNAIVFNAIIGEGCYISPSAFVTGGVKLRSNRFVPPGAMIDTQEKADCLRSVPSSDQEFAQGVIKVNQELSYSYASLFGKTKCSCGLSCCSSTIKDFLE